MKRFKFLEREAIADYAILAEGDEISQAFEAAAEALFSLMFKNLDKVKCKKRIVIQESAKSKDLLLFRFLNDLVYLKDKDRLALAKFKVRLNEKSLMCKCYGQKISKALEQNIDVKGVTLHNLWIKRFNGKYRIHFVVDV
jgi:SHS2 domain-containing protein